MMHYIYNFYRYRCFTSEMATNWLNWIATVQAPKLECFVVNNKEDDQ